MKFGWTSHRVAFFFHNRPKQVNFLMEVILFHVCRLWRSIALELPTLRTIFRYDSWIFYPLGPSFHRLEAYLECSRSHLVDLMFDFRIAHYDCGLRLQMLAKIMAHVTRWRRVFIIADMNTPILDLLDNFKKVSVPNLQHLTKRLCVISNTCVSPTAGVCRRFYPIWEPLSWKLL